ncbi:alanine--tRNA ligase-related protein [Massilia sp. B-10]|nr:alanine--tRNA ligase-related protein [Massilia sp. B-10]
MWAKEVGVPTERIIRIGDNKGSATRPTISGRWPTPARAARAPRSSMTTAPTSAHGPPGSPDEDGDRFIEIWNLVFMQFNHDEAGVMHKLPKPCVDTGMGMERLAAVLQHVHSNYEIDLFQALIKAAARETGATDLENKSLRVIADHIRASAFMIVDGVIPGSEGRAYVLRRIIRRALRHGHKLGQTKAFFYKLVADLAIEMGGAYPELEEAKDRVAQMLKAEEERFGETLETGMKVLEAQLAKDGKGIDGATAFTLYETYGFPPDLTADICRERNLAFDQVSYMTRPSRKARTCRARAARPPRTARLNTAARRTSSSATTTSPSLAVSSRCTPTAPPCRN